MLITIKNTIQFTNKQIVTHYCIFNINKTTLLSTVKDLHKNKLAPKFGTRKEDNKRSNTPAFVY